MNTNLSIGCITVAGEVFFIKGYKTHGIEENTKDIHNRHDMSTQTVVIEFKYNMGGKE